MCQPYSDCACTQTILHICDLRMPYDWFYHDTTQNGRSKDKCVLAHIVCNKICMQIYASRVIPRCVNTVSAVVIAHVHRQV